MGVLSLTEMFLNDKDFLETPEALFPPPVFHSFDGNFAFGGKKTA
jgi:hypothetical protein